MKDKLRIAGWVWLALIAFYFCFKGLIPAWNNDSSDFNNYYASSKLLVEGHEIHTFYDNSQFKELAQENGIEAGAKFSPFPPITAILYTPLTFWDLITAKRIWTVINLILLVLIPFRLRHYYKTPAFRNAIWLSLFFVPLSTNANYGQAYLFFAFILIEAVGLAHNNKKSVAAILISFCAVLKYFPVLYVGYLFGKKDNMRWILVFFLSCLILIGIVYLVDPKSYTYYFSALTNHLQGDLSGQGKFAVGFQSLDSLLNNLFLFDPLENPDPLMNVPVLKPIIKAVIFLTVGLGCFHLFKRDGFAFNPVNVSIFSFAAFALIPASASYHFLLLLIPAFFVAEWLLREGTKKHLFGFMALLILTFLIQYHHVPTLSNFPVVDLLIHYPRLWALFFLFSYLYYNRIKIQHG